MQEQYTESGSEEVCMISERNLKILIFIIALLFIILFYIFIARPKLNYQTINSWQTLDNCSAKNTVINNSESKVSKQEQIFESEATVQIIEVFPVHIMGEVKQPGVYQVDSTMIVQDAIELAGGLTSEADLLLINLANQIQPHQKIYIPCFNDDKLEKVQSENNPVHIFNQNNNPDSALKVDLNTADLNELQTLNGIGPSKAQAIIEYRAKNGSFLKIEDLMQVPGIKEGSFEKIRDKIIVNNHD